MTTSAPAVSGAIETSDRVASHLHPQGSFDLDAHPVPTGREEIWRFTPLRRLRGLHADAPFGDGCEVTLPDAPAGVTVQTVGVDDSVVGSSGYVPTDRVSARAWAGADQAVVVRVAGDTVVEQPVVLRHHGRGTETASAGHTVIVAERFAKATVILQFTGSATLADNVEIVAEDGAQLTVISVQDWADDAVHHSTQHASVGRDASYRHIAVSFGGDVVRHNASVVYQTSGGQAEMLGLYFADAGQHIEHRLFVDHNAPRSVSNVDYRGALQGVDAHAVWIGDVLIRPAAEGIETYESNKNLVLTDGARADSVPNLEIETGEIEGAGHASTTGRFDDEQLFYLRSRGIDEEAARRLVVRGFFADIIQRIGEPGVEEHLLEMLENELAVTMGAAPGDEPGVPGDTASVPAAPATHDAPSVIATDDTDFITTNTQEN